MKTKMIAAILLLACGTAAFAQCTNTSDVLDGSGVLSSGGGYTNISAAGQPGGISQTMAGTLPLNSGTIVNQAGFLNTFFLHPSQLSVHGLPVEMDPDNDGDALSDRAEITGSAFDPVTPSNPNNSSTAGDGVSDGAKAIAGTDPNDPNANLRITAITNAAGQRFIAWRSRGNHERTYRLLASPDPRQPFSIVLFSNTVAGGTAPWYVVTNVVADALATDKLYYCVTVGP